MEAKDISIYVPQDLVRDPEYSNFDVTVWCATALLGNHLCFDSVLVDAAAVAYQLKNGVGYTRNMTSDIADSLRRLIEGGYLNGERTDTKHYIIVRETFDFGTFRYYVKISVENFRRILKENTRPYTLLRYYLLILSTVDYKTKCAYWSNESLSDILGNGTATVSKCFVALEKMQLLYVYRGLNVSNTYGRYENKDEITKFGALRSDYHITEKSATRRRMTQMYNQVKAGHQYDPVVLEDLRNYCQSMNDQEKDIADKNPDYVPKFYDMSIFLVDIDRE